MSSPLLRPLLAALLPLTLSLCAATPPEQGLEVRGGAGAGTYEYTSGGCGTPAYTNRAREGSGYAQLSYRSAIHLGATAEVSGSVNKTTSSMLTEADAMDANGDPYPTSDTDALNNRGSTFMVALRPSAHFAYGGVEVGAALINQRRLSITDSPDEENDTLPSLAPSARAWAGYPEYAYAWVDFIAGPYTEAIPPFGLGVGHASQMWRGELGVRPGFDNNVLLSTEGSYRLAPAFWLGARVSSDFSTNVGGMVTFSTTLSLDDEPE